MARLPQPGSDAGTWGSVLNEFLAVSHTATGQLKSGSVTPTQLQANTPVAGQILTTDGADFVWSSPSDGSAPVPDATVSTKGLIRLSGDLAGDALTPQVGYGKIIGGENGHIATGTIINANIHPTAAISKSKLAPLAITNNDISNSANIAQSKIANLGTTLLGKADTAHIHSIEDITNLQSILSSVGANGPLTIDDIANLQQTLSGKAASVHTHTSGQITNLRSTVADIIGDQIQAGSNVTVNYDDATGITTIASAGGGGSGTPSESVLSVAGRTGDVVLTAGDIASGTLSASRIPNIAATKVTSGEFDIDRIPTGTSSTTVALGNHTHTGYAPTSHTHSASNITSGVLSIDRIPTGTSSTTVAAGNHSHSNYASTSHTHDDRYYTQSETDSLLSDKMNKDQKGVANGLASLGSDGKIPTGQLPALAINNTFTVSSQTAMLALTAQRGDIAIRTDKGSSYILAADAPATLSNWKELIANPTIAAATSTSAGIVELATNAEVVSGTSATRAVTPAALTAALNAAGNVVTVLSGSQSVPNGTPAGLIVRL